MPHAPTQTLISWRDAKSERPPKHFTWYTVLKMFGDHNTVTRLLYDSGFWVRADGEIIPNDQVIAFCLPSDIQTGTFVPVEKVRGLPQHECGYDKMLMVEKGTYILLSDVESLAGKGG